MPWIYKQEKEQASVNSTVTILEPVNIPNVCKECTRHVEWKLKDTATATLTLERVAIVVFTTQSDQKMTKYDKTKKVCLDIFVFTQKVQRSGCDTVRSIGVFGVV